MLKYKTVDLPDSWHWFPVNPDMHVQLSPTHVPPFSQSSLESQPSSRIEWRKQMWNTKIHMSIIKSSVYHLGAIVNFCHIFQNISKILLVFYYTYFAIDDEYRLSLHRIRTCVIFADHCTQSECV